MKFRMNRQGSTRSRDGRVFSAMEGSTREVDDSDVDMCDAIKDLAAGGVVEILDDKPPEGDTDATAGDGASEESEAAPVVEEVEAAPVAHTRYEDRTVVELRELARGRNLPVGGGKDELIARLRGGE